jgi:hypothetical protein
MLDDTSGLYTNSNHSCRLHKSKSTLAQSPCATSWSATITNIIVFCCLLQHDAPGTDADQAIVNNRCPVDSCTLCRAGLGIKPFPLSLKEKGRAEREQEASVPCVLAGPLTCSAWRPLPWQGTVVPGVYCLTSAAMKRYCSFWRPLPQEGTVVPWYVMPGVHYPR